MRGSDQGIGPLVSLAKPPPSKGHPSEVVEMVSMGYRSLSPQTRNTMTEQGTQAVVGKDHKENIYCKD